MPRLARRSLRERRASTWPETGHAARLGAIGLHRFDWLYVTAFVSPATGETFCYVHDGVPKPFFEALLETFAREAGAGLRRTIVHVLDNAGWHGEARLKIPVGVRLVYLPPYTPELQPAETLWTLVDEPVVNKHIDNRRTGRPRRRAMRRSRETARSHQGTSRFPLVAKTRQSELINRKPYHGNGRRYRRKI